MRYIFSFTLLLLPLLLFAQPANDDCATVTTINIGDCTIYNNVGASSDVGFVNFNPPGLTCTPNVNEVWFSFVAPAVGGSDLLISITGVTDGAFPALNQPCATVILGSCPGMFLEATACQQATAGSDFVEFVLSGAPLIPGFEYFVAVSGWSATATPNEGAFEFCITPYVPPADICSGSPATITDCSGSITDSGGDSGDYSANENCIFTISPTVFSQCIVATVNFYNVENFSDFINFYDGPTTASPQILSISGVGAGVEVQASSGAMTIEFISNGTIQESGFEISWNCTTEECTVLGPPLIDTNVTIDDLVDALSSPQVIVSNPVLNCPDGAYATFSSPGNTQLENLGIADGIILSNGLAINAAGPNDTATDFGDALPPFVNDLGEVDLEILTNAGINDACVLEFDVYAATDELKFDYIFGSEEYDEFVNFGVNDAFGFFISGPGITGTYSNNSTNIALLQDGTTPVSINSVNNTGFGVSIDPVTGEVIYIDNQTNPSLSIQYDGMTTVLTARADVIPCNNYHLKLAIGDGGDDVVNSGVFVANLDAGLPQLDVNFAVTDPTGSNILIEGCSNGSDVINATIENPNTDTFTYYIALSGTADEDLDLVTPLPDSLVSLPGTTTFIIPFEPINDGIPEGVETLTLDLFAVFQCDTVIYNSIPILIYDELNVEPTQDTFYVCTGTSVELGVGGATAYTWGWPIPSELNNPNLSNATLTPSQSGYIYVSGIINGNSSCVDSDSAYVQIIDPIVTIDTPAPFICENESVQLNATSNTNNIGISWSPATGLSCTECPNPLATPSETTTYTATVTAGGCQETDNVTVTVDPLGVPSLIDETLICEGSSILLATAPTGTGAAVTSHVWTPNDGSLDDNTSAAPTATPAVTTTYSVTSTSANGACSSTQDVTINVAPATIEIAGPDTIYQCDNALSTITLSATSILTLGDISWTDSNGMTYPNGGTIDVDPTGVTTYYATISVGTCTNSDSVVVQIDSLPNFVLDVSVPSQGIAVTNPDTVGVCSDPTESFFVTNVYNNSLYPNIEHEWSMNGMVYNPAQEGANLLDNLPLSITSYVLESTNNACSSLDTFVIDVNTPPNFTISPSDTIICVGESVQLEATGASDFTWSPDNGTLSDINISNPIATPTVTTTYTAFADIAGCQAGLSMTIVVLETPTINLVSGASVCAGEQISIGLDANNPAYTYTWSPNDFVLGDGTSNPTVAPLVSTTYSVTVSNGTCEIVEDVTVVVNNDLPLTISGNLDLCMGESTTLSANTQGAVNWFDATGTLISNGPTLVVTPTMVGTQVITAEAFNNFCSSTQSVTITTSTTPTLTASVDQDICAGETANISATTDATSLSWSPANEFTDPTLAMQTVSPSGTTTYTATASNNGCEVSDDVIINVSDAPIYSVRDDATICIGQAIGLGLLNDPATIYSWTASPTDPTLVDTGIGNPTVVPTVTTIYTLTATNGLCTETDEVIITVVDPSVSVIKNDTICAGEEAMLVAIGSPTGGTYSWADWEGNTVGTDDTLLISPFASTSYSAIYELDGCITTAIGEVEVITTPNTNLTATAVEIVAGESSTLTVTGAPANSTLVWTNVVTDETLTETTATITVSPDVTTDYLVTITTPEGCVYTERIRIEVIFQELNIPNVFTPNNDGLNDEFYPIFSDLSMDLIEFKVFDRWGELVHDNISQGWDGYVNGKKSPADIYVYFLRVRFNDGTEEFQKGDVALMR